MNMAGPGLAMNMGGGGLINSGNTVKLQAIESNF